MLNSRVAALFATMVAAIGVMVFATPAASAAGLARPATLSAPYYYLYNSLSNRCLSPAGGSTDLNAATVIYNCDGNQARVWEFVQVGYNMYEVVNTNSGLCLSPAGGAGANNTVTVIYTCDDAPARRWYLSNYQLVNIGTSKCLSPAGGGVANNTLTVIYNCDSDPARTWWPTFD